MKRIIVVEIEGWWPTIVDLLWTQESVRTVHIVDEEKSESVLEVVSH